jgi:predicted chitinase
MNYSTIIGMTAARKVKVSVSIDPSVLSAVDRYAARTGVTRSAAMERWLAQVSHRENLTRLEEETASYYDALSEAERQDDAGWAVGASSAARRLGFEGPRNKRRRNK